VNKEGKGKAKGGDFRYIRKVLLGREKGEMEVQILGVIGISFLSNLRCVPFIFNHQSCLSFPPKSASKNFPQNPLSGTNPMKTRDKPNVELM